MDALQEIEKLRKRNLTLQHEIEELKLNIKPSSRRKKENLPVAKEKEVENLVVENNNILSETDYNAIKFDADFGILVISLFPNMLNLCTEKLGRGKCYTFSSINDSKIIPYKHLIAILENYSHFYVQGLFTIENIDFKKKHGLADSNISPLQLTNIINKIYDVETSIAIFESLTAAQMEMLCKSLLDKMILEGESYYDFYFLQKIIRVSGYDILAVLEDVKGIRESILEYENELNAKRALAEEKLESIRSMPRFDKIPR